MVDEGANSKEERGEDERVVRVGCFWSVGESWDEDRIRSNALKDRLTILLDVPVIWVPKLAVVELDEGGMGVDREGETFRQVESLGVAVHRELEEVSQEEEGVGDEGDGFGPRDDSEAARGVF